MRIGVEYTPIADHDEYYRPRYVLNKNFIISFLQERGISARQFCNICGITIGAYKNFLKTKDFSLYFFDVAEAIARVMGVKIIDLYEVI